MDIPAHFKMNDTAEIRTFVIAHPFGALFTNEQTSPASDSLTDAASAR